MSQTSINTVSKGDNGCGCDTIIIKTEQLFDLVACHPLLILRGYVADSIPCVFIATLHGTYAHEAVAKT